MSVDAGQLRVGDLWLMEKSQKLQLLIGIMKEAPSQGAFRLYWLDLQSQRMHTALYPSSFTINILARSEP